MSLYPTAQNNGKVWTLVPIAEPVSNVVVLDYNTIGTNPAYSYTRFVTFQFTNAGDAGTMAVEVYGPEGWSPYEGGAAVAANEAFTVSIGPWTGYRLTFSGTGGTAELGVTFWSDNSELAVQAVRTGLVVVQDEIDILQDDVDALEADVAALQVHGLLDGGQGTPTSGSGESIVAQYQVAADATAAGAAYLVRVEGVSSINGTLIFKVRTGGATVGTSTAIFTSTTSAAQSANAHAGMLVQLAVRTIGAGGTIVGDGTVHAISVSHSAATGAVVVGNINTTVPWYITMTCTCSAGTYTPTLYTVQRL